MQCRTLAKFGHVGSAKVVVFSNTDVRFQVLGTVYQSKSFWIVYQSKNRDGDLHDDPHCGCVHSYTKSIRVPVLHVVPQLNRLPWNFQGNNLRNY